MAVEAAGTSTRRQDWRVLHERPSALPRPDARGAPTTEERAEPAEGQTPEGSPIAADVAERARQYVTEAVRRIEAEEGAGTPLAERIDVVATPQGVRVDVDSPRPGTLIGARGTTIEGLRSGVAEATGGYVALNVVPACD